MAEETKITFANQLNQYFYKKGTPSVTSSLRVPLLDANGNAIGSNTVSSLAATVRSISPTIDTAYFNRPEIQAEFDNIFIAVTRINDNFPLLIRPDAWASYADTSTYHTAGVAIVNGGTHGIVVAKDEFNGTKQWGPQGTLVGTAVTSRAAALKDLTGQTRTPSIAANTTYSSTDYAAAWCNAYQQTGEAEAYANKSSGSTAWNMRQAGKWWLPSPGELWMIYQNFYKINQCLTLIESKQSGTTMQLQKTSYWSSTENSANSAWSLYFNYGGFGGINKTNTPRVRAVSAL